MTAAGHWLLPPRCVLCGAVPDAGPGALCLGCRSDLQANEPACPRCAEPLVQPEPLCGHCLRREPPFAAAFAACRYAWPLDGLVARFKFSGDVAAGRCLAELFVARLAQTPMPRPDVIVPVPLHRHRLRRRGYDQALELARDIRRGTGIPMAADLLQRRRATRAQTDLDLAGRRRNVRGAFAVNEAARRRLPADPQVVLFDDVMTTGSTLAECARSLRRVGIRRIQVWVIARAPARRSGVAVGAVSGMAGTPE
ncbi:MAG: ComF family protein [Xanthomonadales bacterium]|nr:ComF family protein [Xanthomonadales bacterium]